MATLRLTQHLLLAVLVLSAASCEGCDDAAPGQLGDPCIPADEGQPNFPGADFDLQSVDGDAPDCESGVCLVNHFQGRVACPRGQAAPRICTHGEPCLPGEVCRAADVLLSDCDPTPCAEAADPFNCSESDGSNAACGGRPCLDGGHCSCTSDDQCPSAYACCVEGNADEACQDARQLCLLKVCTPEPRDDTTRCYLPGTDAPVTVPVCGWCGARQPTDAVYCSCRCAGPSGGPPVPEDELCECPAGFDCVVLGDLGLGEPQGSYCVKAGTSVVPSAEACGAVEGAWATDRCAGTPDG